MSGVMNKYSEIINTIFNKKFLPAFIENNHDAYNTALAQKEAYKLHWQVLLAELKFIDENVSLRDVGGGAASHCNKVMLGLGEWEHGIILNICHFAKTFGFYYCHYAIPPTIEVMSKDKTSFAHVSYYPYNEIQENLAMKVISIAEKHFNGFELFDNIYASQKISNVIINDTIFEEVDCFQLLFGDEITALY
jgi:hypothetical protein